MYIYVYIYIYIYGTEGSRSASRPPRFTEKRTVTTNFG